MLIAGAASATWMKRQALRTRPSRRSENYNVVGLWRRTPAAGGLKRRFRQR